jgi:hypothetical protein
LLKGGQSVKLVDFVAGKDRACRDDFIVDIHRTRVKNVDDGRVAGIWLSLGFARDSLQFRRTFDAKDFALDSGWGKYTNVVVNRPFDTSGGVSKVSIPTRPGAAR